MIHSLAYLSRLCLRWGGELRLLSEDGFRVESHADGRTRHPSLHHAIDRGERLILAVRRHVSPGAVIHEMGHVFLEEEDPADTHEPDWLGWEIALARRARCYREWSNQNIGYNFSFDGQECEWGALTATEERRLVAERIDYAMALGVVSQDGVPLRTRRSA